MAVDESDLNMQGWIAVDDLNFRCIFPDTIEISTSTDKQAWTQLTVLNMVNQTKRTVDVPEDTTARYVRFVLPRDDIDSGFLSLIEILKKTVVLGEEIPVVDGVADLGAVAAINGVIANFTDASPKNIVVSVSEDGQKWTPVYQTIEADGTQIEMVFGEIEAQYIRFEGDIDSIISISAHYVNAPEGADYNPEDPDNPDNPDKPVNPFVDVEEGQYFYDAVMWAVNHTPQITNGTDATHFTPNGVCTRAQVVTFLWRAKGCPEPETSENPFTDVKAGTYYYEAVLWAAESGITTGTSKTTFSPGRGCTRAEVVTFLWRTQGEPKPSTSNNPFSDVKQNAYYFQAVLWAAENEITLGTSATQFSPNRSCTRGQIVTFLYRTFQ